VKKRGKNPRELLRKRRKTLNIEKSLKKVKRKMSIEKKSEKIRIEKKSRQQRIHQACIGLMWHDICSHLLAGFIDTTCKCNLVFILSALKELSVFVNVFAYLGKLFSFGL
jgi:hypothetical protein